MRILFWGLLLAGLAFLGNKYYFAPMKELQKDQLILKEQKEKAQVVNGLEKVFTEEIKKQKAQVKEKNNEIKPKMPKIDLSVGTHTISI